MIIEDNQVYTTARSEEIKRKVKSLIKNLNEKVEKYLREREKRTVYQKTDIPKFSIDKKLQNIKLEVDEKEKNLLSENDNKLTFSMKNGRITNKSLHKIATYILFFLIILIIALGIYLPYSR